jgi:hypothetical protein
MLIATSEKPRAAEQAVYHIALPSTQPAIILLS